MSGEPDIDWDGLDGTEHPDGSPAPIEPVVEPVADPVVDDDVDPFIKFFTPPVQDLEAPGPIVVSLPSLLDFEIKPPSALFVDEKGGVLIPDHSYGMIFAPAGLGKTLFCMGLGLAAASGGSFGPFTSTRKMKILYVDSEMRLADLKDRCEKLTFEYKGEQTDAVLTHFKVLPSECHTVTGLSLLPGTPGLLVIDAAIAAEKPDLVVIDNISTLAGGLDENSSSEWDPINRWAVAQRYERSVWFVHHANKGGEKQSGTSMRSRSLDFEIRMSANGDQNPNPRFKVEWVKHRGFAQPGEIDVTLENVVTDQGEPGLRCVRVTTEQAISDRQNSLLEKMIPLARQVIRDCPSANRREQRTELRELAKSELHQGARNSILDRALDMAHSEESYGKFNP